MKWLNFWWTEAGHNLGNFGIVGLTYNWVNGFPKYTDLIMKNPEGLGVVNALSKYAPDGGSGRMWIQDARYWEQMMALDAQTVSGKMLQATADHSRVLPTVTPTAEESRELATLMSEIGTYRDEMFAKFVVGAEPLSNFNAYVQRINGMGLARAIEIMQSALGALREAADPQVLGRGRVPHGTHKSAEQSALFFLSARGGQGPRTSWAAEVAEAPQV